MMEEKQNQVENMEKKPEQPKSATVAEPVKKTSKKIAVIRLRGLPRIRTTVKNTMNMLHLQKRNHCIVIDDEPSRMGMIKKVKDYITWGPIDSETLKMLIEKRGEKDASGNQKPYFRLHPPKKGLERKGIKKTFKVGGALGPRGEKINDLIKRML